MDIQKILTYIARPEGLGLHGPILETLGPKIFDIREIDKLAVQGNLWATKILVEDRTSEYWWYLLVDVVRDGLVEQLKIILDGVDNAQIMKGGWDMLHSAICDSIDENYVDVIEILLNRNLIGPYAFIKRALSINKTEIIKLFIKNGAKDWKNCVDWVIYHNNIELIKFMIAEFPEILTNGNLSFCICLASAHGKPDMTKWFSDKLQSL